MSNEDQTNPTAAKILPAHSHKETVTTLLDHLWFGDLVASRWWFDLWSETSKE